MASKKKAAKKKTAKKAVKKAVKKTVKKVSKPVKKVKKSASKKVPAKPKNTKAAKAKAKPASGKGSKPLMKSAPAPKRSNIDYSKAITPLMDRLVVRVMNSERLSAGGLIIIPDTALMATGYLKAEVLAVGSGTKSKRGYLKPLDVKVGDKVLFAEYAGTKVQFNSEDLHIIHESDVMGILEE
jgi:chaperonin GroES